MRFLSEKALESIAVAFAKELRESNDYIEILKNFYEINECEKEQFINFFSNELASFTDDLASTDIIDYDTSLNITTYLAINDYTNLFYLAIEEWLYSYIKLNATLSKGKITRELLIPLRALLDEAMIAIIASLNILGNSHVKITTSEGYNFLFDLDDDSEYSDYASDYYAMDINQLDDPHLIYEGDDVYSFSLKIDGVKQLKNNYTAPVIITSGSGNMFSNDNNIDLEAENNDIKNKYAKLASMYEIY